jgi:hypothetical protein
LISAGFEDVISFRIQYYEENGLTEDQIKAWWQEQIPKLRDKHWRRFVRCTLNRASQRKKIGALP